MGKSQHHDQPFTPDTVDEQIERIISQQDQQQSQTSMNEHVVRDLHTVYEEDAELLARVRERFVSSITETDHVQEPIVLQQDRPGRLITAEQPYTSAPPASRRRFTLLVAGLVAAFIIGSMLAVFTFVRPLGTQVASPQQQQTPSGLYKGSGDTVYRMDQRSGKVIWQYRLPDDRKANFGSHPPRVVILNTGPDNTVYAVSESTVYAIDATRGTLRWSNTLFKLVVIVSKPVISGNRVYVPVNDRVYALNTANGKLLATYSVGPTAEPKQLTPVAWSGGVSYKEGNHDEMVRNAIRATVNNNTLYIERHSTLYALSLRDGKQLWHRQVDQNQQFTMPQIENGKVYVSSYSITSSNQVSYLYALNAQTGATIWQSKIPDGLVYDVAVDHGVIYGTVNEKRVFTYDASAGKPLWSKGINVTEAFAAPIIDGSTAYITAFSKTASAAQTKDVYVGFPMMVVALDIRNGSVKWTYPGDLQGKRGIAIIVENGVIYVNELHSGTYALNNKGKIIWRNKSGDQANGLSMVAVP